MRHDACPRSVRLFVAIHAPPLRLPGKGRMIVWTVVNVEEWEITRPMARQLSMAPQGQSAIPDMPNWTWYEYGMRVGFWRLMRALDKARRHADDVAQRQDLRDLPGRRHRRARRRLGIPRAFLRADADPADRGPARRDAPVDRHHRGVHREEADRLARARAAGRPSRRSTTRPNAGSRGSPTGCSTTSRSG